MGNKGIYSMGEGYKNLILSEKEEKQRAIDQERREISDCISLKEFCTSRLYLYKKTKLTNLLSSN